MFRAICLFIIAVCTVGSIWLSFVSQEEYETTVADVTQYVTTLDEKVWAKIANHIEVREDISALQEKDMRFVRSYLRSRLGSETYLEMAENKCLDTVVYKLAVFDGVWVDHWCANQYRQVEAWYKQDLMMFMAYRYELDQPESLKNTIKQNRVGS